MLEKPEKITERILSSRKYRGLYRGTVERIVQDSLVKARQAYPNLVSSKIVERGEEIARNLLHQVWGAFYPTRPSWTKLLAKIDVALANGATPKEAVLPILDLHSSTSERLPFLADFYPKIFSVTGLPQTVADHGCGLNPLTFPWMGLSREVAYRAFDIDLEEIDFLNSAFARFGWGHFRAEARDVLMESTDNVDVVFLLKLLPVLEHERGGASWEILHNFPAKYLVVSFPTASLSGREKGMVDFYGSRFESQLSSLGWHFDRLDFAGELVYVIRKQ